MEVTLQYFDDCPNWQTAAAHLAALADESIDLTVRFERIEDAEQAERRGFRGSPSLLVDDKDLFADQASVVGLACRVYRTESGLAGAPTLDQIRAALASRQPPPAAG